MKLKALIASSLLLSSTAFADFYVQNGDVMAEVQTYIKGEKKIVLIDMIHVAPKSFYKDVNRLLKSYKDSNPLILEEGVKHCESAGDVSYLPGPTANFEILTQLYKRRNEFDVASAEASLTLAGFYKRKCQGGSSNEAPGIIDRFASRFSMYGLIAGIGFVRSQGSIKVYPNGMKVESGDIASARFENPITKALAGSVVECMLSLRAEGGCVPFKKWAQTEDGKKLSDELILDLRNDVLLGATFSSLGLTSSFGQGYDFPVGDGSAHNTVLLPWGAAHMPGGLLKAIESQGFVKAAKSGIKYTDCARVKRNILLGSLLGEDAAVKAGCNL